MKNKNQLKQDGDIIIYQTEDCLTTINVSVKDETVWLSLDQMSALFLRDKSTISRHIKNIFNEGELQPLSVIAKYATTASDGKTYQVDYYNLDVIISVGYRVKSKRGTQFRQWANRVLKEYLLRGYSINQHLLLMEQRIDHQLQEHSEQIHQLEEKVEFFISTSIPPKEGIFFDGQIFDAYSFISDLIRTAKKTHHLI